VAAEFHVCLAVIDQDESGAVGKASALLDAVGKASALPDATRKAEALPTG
jgi:hypothetical protein